MAAVSPEPLRAVAEYAAAAEQYIRVHPEGLTPEQAQRLIAGGLLALAVLKEQIHVVAYPPHPMVRSRQ